MRVKMFENEDEPKAVSFADMETDTLYKDEDGDVCSKDDDGNIIIYSPEPFLYTPNHYEKENTTFTKLPSGYTITITQE